MSTKSGAKPVTVSKVGRDYFYLAERSYSKDKISLDDLMYRAPNYPQHNYRLYISDQEILDEQEIYRLSVDIRCHFDYFKMPQNTTTLDQLRAISEILGIKKQDK